MTYDSIIGFNNGYVTVLIFKASMWCVGETIVHPEVRPRERERPDKGPGNAFNMKYIVCQEMCVHNFLISVSFGR